MSMISELVEKLKKYATEYDLPPFGREIEGTKELLNQAADTIEALSAKVAAANTERSERYYNGGWILCEDRLPTKEESIKNDNRFILDDGNRRYEGCFDYIDNRFVRFNCDGMQTDKCAIAWCEMPSPYRQ